MCHFTIYEFELMSLYRNNFRKFFTLDSLLTAIIIVFMCFSLLV